MQTLSLNDDFPPGFYEEFARLVVAFGRLEYLIKLCVKDLLAEGFTKGMAEAESLLNFSKLCDNAKRQAAQKLSQTQEKAFSELIDRAKAVAEFRHNTVHALWTGGPNGLPLRIRPKWDKTKKSVDLSRSLVVLVSELQGEREKIERLYQDLEAGRKAWSIYVT